MDAWQANFDAYVAFKAGGGREPSTTAKDEAENQLGIWVGNQRTAAKSGTLSDERKRLLEGVGLKHAKDLSEGVDVPVSDLTALNIPKRSESEIAKTISIIKRCFPNESPAVSEWAASQQKVDRPRGG